jgi:hypothetical protein
MEAGSTIGRIAPYVEAYCSNITVAYPMKLNMISQSMKKTDRNDVHILLVSGSMASLSFSNSTGLRILTSNFSDDLTMALN